MKEKKKTPGPGVHSLPEERWPTADRAAWQEARRPSVRLQRGGAASHLRPVVQHDLRKRYGLFLDFLSRSSRFDMNAPAGAQVTSENVDPYVAELKNRVSSVTVYGSIQKLRRFVQLIAPGGDLSWLIDIERQLYADENAVLVIDETGFLKQGKASCGVARQYTGSAGKITNCQIGVFAAYVSRHGHAFIDRALYLPKAWTDDPARLKATYVPGDIGFSTKPQLAAEMIERALAAGVPFRWVAADSVYGVGDIERDLRQAGKGYVLGVNSNHWFASWGKPQWVVGTAEEIAKTQRRSDWRRLSAGAGTKGPRLHDWCYLELADLEGEESNHHSQVLWTRGLLIRRNIANGDLAYFTTWCPAGTSIKTLVRVEGHRWAIEDSFETAKNEFGLDHNESRSWHGWHRHVSLVMLAFAMMAAIQHQANKPTPKKRQCAHRDCAPVATTN